MKKVYLICAICFVLSCCSTKDNIDKELLDSIYKITIQNRASHIFGGIEEYNSSDKKEIALLCKELLALKKENSLQTKPFEGTIFINFLKKDNDGMGEYINILSTSIIFKPDSQYFITNSRGQYTSDPFLAKILKYLQIDQSAVSALDAYRKNK